jgi:hypothetical protein
MKKLKTIDPQLYNLLASMMNGDGIEPTIGETDKGEIIIYTGMEKRRNKYVPARSEVLEGK